MAFIKKYLTQDEPSNPNKTTSNSDDIKQYLKCRQGPKMVRIGKSGFDSKFYAKFYEEHDWHLVLMGGSLIMSKLMILEAPTVVESIPGTKTGLS